MITSSIRINVAGDTYYEIFDAAINILAGVLEIPADEVEDRANIEISITENEPFDSDASYSAEIIARLRNVR